MKQHRYFVYIMSNRKDGVLYIGVTSNLERRIVEHKYRMIKGFSKRYNLGKLIYFEETQDVHAALQREKNLKHYIRQWKVDLIESVNPEWKDLAAEWNLGDPRVSCFARPEDDKIC